MVAFKYHKTDKFAYCRECYTRVNRVYQRAKKTGVFVGFAWYCKECESFTLDVNVEWIHRN